VRARFAGQRYALVRRKRCNTRQSMRRSGDIGSDGCSQIPLSIEDLHLKCLLRVSEKTIASSRGTRHVDIAQNPKAGGIVNAGRTANSKRRLISMNLISPNYNMTRAALREARRSGILV